MMTARFEIVFLVFAVVLFAGVIELARRRRVRGKYTGVWLLLCTSVLGLALFPKSINLLAGAMGVHDGANALFFVAITLILLMLVEFSAIATSLHRKNRDLLKQVSLLTWRVEQLEETLESALTDGKGGVPPAP